MPVLCRPCRRVLPALGAAVVAALIALLIWHAWMLLEALIARWLLALWVLALGLPESGPP